MTAVSSRHRPGAGAPLPEAGKPPGWGADLRRALRRLSWRLRAPALDVVFSEQYAVGWAGVPHDPHRSRKVLTFLAAEGLVGKRHLHTPAPASLRALARVHTDDYLESLHDPGVLVGIIGIEGDASLLDRYVETQRYMVGGTMLATRLALGRRTGRGAVVNLGGGLHHAHADRGQGFCLFNDVGVAIAAQRRQGFDGRILVVDLDLHHGDGTEALFARDETVHTFSIHNQLWWEGEAVAATRVQLDGPVEDEGYLEALCRHLPPVIESVRPQLVFYLAGCDVAAGDRIGNWRLSAEGILERDRFVYRALGTGGNRPPLVVLMAGGYGEHSWRYTARFLSWLATGGKVIEPPSTEEIVLLGYRHLARLLNPHELTGMGSEGWDLTAEDVYGALGANLKESRFLGYYSKHGIEQVLERSGLFDRLRALGFSQFRLEWNLDDPSAQTLRLFGDGERRELLAELRARRDRSTLAGMELLRVEWLLLQNPRRQFLPGQQPLPGQAHPGLGQLREVVALLILMCDRLHLDGLCFVPSHYHLAATSAKHLVFLDPRHAALFDKLGRALEGSSLGAASRAVDEGRLRYRESGEVFRWEPMPMVLPVSERLAGKIRGEDYERRRQQAQAELSELELVE